MRDKLYKHYFYPRYIWEADDFQIMQNSETGLPEGIAESLFKGAVVDGLDYGGATGLNVSINTGAGFSATGDTLAATAIQQVTVQGHATLVVKNLIVARSKKTDIDNISRPTSPFDIVPLRSEQKAEFLVRSGTPGGGWPTKTAGDVVLFGVEAITGITSLDLARCEYLTKQSNLRFSQPYDYTVGNYQWATHKFLADVVALLAAGDRVRVVDDQTIDSVLTISAPDVQIDFDRGAKLIKGAAATGLVIAASGVVVDNITCQNYTGGSDYGIAIGVSADACTITKAVFKNSPNAVLDLSDGAAIVSPHVI